MKIEKISKATFKKVRALLRDKEERHKTGLFVAEGLKIVKDMISKKHALESVIVSANFAEKAENKDFLNKFSEKSIPVFSVKTSEFEKVSSLKHSQGIMATAKKHTFSAGALTARGASFLVLCDGVQDPGNLGAIIRTSAAFGAGGVLLTGEAQDVYSPKVIRSSSGTVLDVPVCACGFSTIDHLKKEGFKLLVSWPRAKESKDISKLKKSSSPRIIAFGSEGKGISKEITSRADDFFHIPVSKKVESLNVTASCAIALFVFSAKGV